MFFELRKYPLQSPKKYADQRILLDLPVAPFA